MSRFLFVLSFVFVLSVFSWDGVLPYLAAQDANAEQQRRERRERRAQEMQQRQEALFQGKVPKGTATVVGRSVIYSVDRGFGSTIALMEAADNANVRNEIGLTEDQAEQLKAAKNELRMQMLFLAPKYADRFKKMGEADHEAIQKDIEKEIKSISDRVDNIATPEQKAKVQKLTFQAMGGLDSPIINMDAMSTLNLSEDQKEKMRSTLKEMEKERLSQMEEGLKLVEKAIERGGVNMSEEDRKTLEAEGKALQGQIIATGKKLGDRLRTHLTDEQLAMEKDLMANRPSYLPRLPRQMRGDFTQQYSPGLDSWVPGQGVPRDRVDSKRHRRPFPSKESE